MFGAEGGEWRRIEKRAEQNQLVESAGAFPIAAKKNRDQANCKNHSTDEVRPIHLAGDYDQSNHHRGIYHFASASRFCFAQPLSDATAFIGGPPSVPQAQGPCILASVMQKHDFVFKQAQT